MAILRARSVCSSAAFVIIDQGTAMRPAILLCVWLPAVSPLLAQSPAEVLRRAAESSGEKVISSAEIEFEAVIESAAPHDEQVAKMAARREEAIRSVIEMYKKANQPKLQQQYEKLLANNQAVAEEQAKQFAHREITGFYWMFGPKFGGDRLYEVRVRNRTLDPSSFLLLQRQLDENSLRSVVFEVGLRLATVSAAGVSPGVMEPALIGRLLGRPLSVVESGSDLRCSYDDTYQGKNASEVCIKFSVDIADAKDAVASQKSDAESVDNGSLVGRVVVDPARGHICPLVEYGHSEEEPTMRVECAVYFRAASTDLWFPRSCVFKSNIGGEEKSTRMRFRPDTVRLNHSLPRDVFSVTIPQGTHLAYNLGEAQERKAVCDVRITIDELDSLLSHRCLQGKGVQPITVESRWRSLLVYGNLALILLLVLVFVLRRRRKVASY